MRRLLGRRLLSVRGEHASQLLQGIVTNDIRLLDGAMMMRRLLAALVLDTKGRILDDILVSRRSPDVFLVECATERATPLKALLERYRLRKKAEISLSDVAILWSTKEGDNSAAFPDPRLAGLGVRMYEERTANEVESGDDEYRHLRYSLGIAEGAELAGQLPWNANADFLSQVSTSKGCYLGQELTARTATQGMLRKRVLPFRAELRVEEGATILDEKQKNIGRVLASDESGLGLAHVALSVLQKQTATVSGQPITVTQPEWMVGDLHKVHV